MKHNVLGVPRLSIFRAAPIAKWQQAAGLPKNAFTSNGITALGLLPFHQKCGRAVGLVAPTNHPCCRYTPNAVRRLEHSCSAKAEHRRSEGSLPSGADHRATPLYSAGPEGA